MSGTTLPIQQDSDTGLGREVVIPTPGQVMRMRMRRHKGFIAGAICVLLVFMMAIFAPVLTPYNPYTQHLSERLIPPVWDARGAWKHPLGTDNLGRDYLSRLVYGSRVSLLIGFHAC